MCGVGETKNRDVDNKTIFDRLKCVARAYGDHLPKMYLFPFPFLFIYLFIYFTAAFVYDQILQHFFGLV